MSLIRWFFAWRFRRMYPLYGKLIVCDHSDAPHRFMPGRCPGARTPET